MEASDVYRLEVPGRIRQVAYLRRSNRLPLRVEIEGGAMTIYRLVEWLPGHRRGLERDQRAWRRRDPAERDRADARPAAPGRPLHVLDPGAQCGRRGAHAGVRAGHSELTLRAGRLLKVGGAPRGPTRSGSVSRILS